MWTSKNETFQNVGKKFRILAIFKQEQQLN